MNTAAELKFALPLFKLTGPKTKYKSLLGAWALARYATVAHTKALVLIPKSS